MSFFNKVVYNQKKVVKGQLQTVSYQLSKLAYYNLKMPLFLIHNRDKKNNQKNIIETVKMLIDNALRILNKLFIVFCLNPGHPGLVIKTFGKMKASSYSFDSVCEKL